MEELVPRPVLVLPEGMGELVLIETAELLGPVCGEV